MLPGRVKFVSGRDKIALPADFRSMERSASAPSYRFGIEAELKISLPGLDRESAQKLVDAAHIVCPYSKRHRGNIDVTLTILYRRVRIDGPGRRHQRRPSAYNRRSSLTKIRND